VAAAVQQIQVPDVGSMEQAITSYIAQGFTVQARTENSATLFKKKEFSVLWAVVGLVLCLLPLLIYLIVYATQKDEMVQIVVVGTAVAKVNWNDDFTQWYDHGGGQWVSTATRLPEGTHVSEDGSQFYNGSSWVRIPAELQASLASSPEAPAAPPDDPAAPASNGGA
jgi:hypothetical protein